MSSPSSRSRSASVKEQFSMRNSQGDQSVDQSQIWIQAYTQLEQDLAAKENEVAMVAEIGKQLLEKNQEQQQLIQQLEEREAHNTSLIAELEEKLSQISSESRNRTTSEGESTLPVHSGYIEQEYKRIQEKNEQISEAYEALQHQFDDLTAQQKKKEKQSQNEIAELKKSVQGFEEQAQGYQSLFEQLNTRDLDYKKLVSQMEAEKEERHNQQEELEKKHQTLNSYVFGDEKEAEGIFLILQFIWKISLILSCSTSCISQAAHLDLSLRNCR
eukprot:TRINITY_DN493_c0_g1_i3.p2 TRINITY_DN493_c0_g1~~TRINITY_DN493_c0_g1_i3.p2  ORF type:complete len:272 (-),score=110.80 TRINITY_DN493_c0_g1_i3:1155-1970(-)